MGWRSGTWSLPPRGGLAWTEADGDGPEYFGLVFGQGVSPRELAVRLGAPEDSPVLDPATIERIEQAWPTHRYDDPNIGRIGDAGNGWSFCLLPCAAMETSGSDNPWGEVTGRTLPGMVCEPREFRNARHAPEGPTERNPTWDRLRALGFDL